VERQTSFRRLGSTTARRRWISEVTTPMRLLRLASLAALALVLLAACSSSGSTPNWTYAPAASATPVASGSAAASGSPAASGAASASPVASASAAASGGAGGGATVEIVASGIQFTTTDVTAPAGQKLTLTFKNEDAGVPHDVDIKDANGGDVVKTEVFNGVDQKSVEFGPLQAGSYPFVCNVHPNMKGTLTVQ
jgi:plastocyanin